MIVYKCDICGKEHKYKTDLHYISLVRADPDEKRDNKFFDACEDCRKKVEQFIEDMKKEQTNYEENKQ